MNELFFFILILSNIVVIGSWIYDLVSYFRNKKFWIRQDSFFKMRDRGPNLDDWKGIIKVSDNYSTEKYII